MPAKSKQFRRPSRTETVAFPLDPNDAGDLRVLQQALKAAKDVVEDAGADATVEQHTAVEKAKAEYDAALADHETITFHLQALSGARLQILQTENPPTPDQVKAVKVTDPDANLEYDPEKYPPALLAAACTKVEWSDGTEQKKLTVEQATDFWETSSTGDQEFLMTAIGMLNNVPSLVAALGKD
jgi:hypothetical protein